MRWMIAGVFGVAMVAAPQLASAQDRCERGYSSAYRSYGYGYDRGGYGYDRGYGYRDSYARGNWGGRSRAYESRNAYGRNGSYGAQYGNNYSNNGSYNGGNYANNYNPHPNGIATGPTIGNSNNYAYQQQPQMNNGYASNGANSNRSGSWSGQRRSR